MLNDSKLSIPEMGKVENVSGCRQLGSSHCLFRY